MKNDDIELLLTLRNPIALITSASPNRTENTKVLRVRQTKLDADFVKHAGHKVMKVTVIGYQRHDAKNNELSSPAEGIPIEIQLSNIIAKQPL
jgi:hypothetical protein